MNLEDLSVGKSAKIVAVHGNGETPRRLMEMGVVPGVEVRLVKSAPFGDPIEIRLLGYNLAIRRNEAASIEIADY